MLRKSRRLTIFRALAFLLLGVLSGIQIALYLYDYYDDGIAEFGSLLIGLAMLAASIGFVAYSYRQKRPRDQA